jgi:acetyl esterase/lipase
MSKYIIAQLSAFLFLFLPFLNGQQVIPLWQALEKPYYIENDLVEYEQELWGTRCVFNITDPYISLYRPDSISCNVAVLIIPGGGYGLVALYHEGFELAQILSKNGITSAVLKYRIPDPSSSGYPEKVPLTDARRALQLLHESVAEFENHPLKIGVLGFSAGSHLATVLSLWKSENQDENPDFSALIYGVTEMNKENQNWLEENLYHRKMSEEELTSYTLLNLVNKETVPTFLVHALDDETCRVEESTSYAAKLQEYGVPYEMHLFSKGGHGFGIGRSSDGSDQWVHLFINWLKNNL